MHLNLNSQSKYTICIYFFIFHISIKYLFKVFFNSSWYLIDSQWMSAVNFRWLFLLLLTSSIQFRRLFWLLIKLATSLLLTSSVLIPLTILSLLVSYETSLILNDFTFHHWKQSNQNLLRNPHYQLWYSSNSSMSPLLYHN